MQTLLARIAEVKGCEIQKVLDAVLERYAQLCPDWVVSTVSVFRYADKNQQLDQMIRLLQNMKEQEENKTV